MGNTRIFQNECWYSGHIHIFYSLLFISYPATQTTVWLSLTALVMSLVVLSHHAVQHCVNLQNTILKLLSHENFDSQFYLWWCATRWWRRAITALRTLFWLSMTSLSWVVVLQTNACIRTTDEPPIACVSWFFLSKLSKINKGQMKMLLISMVAVLMFSCFTCVKS